MNRRDQIIIAAAAFAATIATAQKRSDEAEADEEELRGYYFTLEPTNFNINKFIANWARINEVPSQRLLQIALQRTARIAYGLRDEEKDALRRFLRDPAGIPQWADNFAPHLANSIPRNLAAIIWSMGELETRAPIKFMAEWRKSTHAKLRDMNELDLLDTVRGFKNLTINPGDKFMNALFSYASPKLVEWDMDQLSHFIWACGQISSKAPSYFLDRCMEHAENLEFGRNDGKTAAASLRRFLSGITTLSAISDYTPETLSVLELIDEIKRLSAKDDDNRLYLNQMGAWHDIPGYTPSNIPKARDSEWISRLQKEFGAVKGFKQEDIVVDGLSYHPVISGKYKGTPVIIEPDSPRSFMIMLEENSTMFNGPVVLRSSIMEKKAGDARILRLCYVDFNEASEQVNGSADSSIDYEDIIKRLTSEAAGIYRSDFEDKKIVFVPLAGNSIG